MTDSGFSIDSNKLKHSDFSAALIQSTGFKSSRLGLQIEIAVGILTYAQETTSSTGKAFLKSVYHGAGYDCMQKFGRDYKTVNRRLNRIAKLFDFLGLDEIIQWYDKDNNQKERIAKIAERLADYGFDKFDDVADFVGVNSGRTRARSEPANNLSLEEIKERLLEEYDDELLYLFANDLLKVVSSRRQV